MKRPQGFDGPATPPAGPPAGTKAAPARSPKTAGIRRPLKPTVPGNRAAADEATTEPITVQSAAQSTAAHPTKPHPTKPQRTAAHPIAPVSPFRRRPKPVGDPPAGPVVDPQPAQAALTPADARRKFRAARRARKLYEREEVRRFTWRSRRRRMVWLVSFAAAAALAAFVLVGAYSPLMALRTIEVVGSNRVPAEQIQAALGGQLGTPLPLVDLSRVKKDLSAFTLIQSYVTESRPPGTLVVRIVERAPIVAIVTANGFDLIDAAGVVIQSGAERPAGYATIEARVGSAGFRAATAVIAALPEGIRTGLDTVTAATTDDVTLTLIGGARVVWGSAEKSEYKAVVLAALIVSHPVGSVGEYDVSSPDSAVLR
jgi:cell division protein FtsQ